MKCTDMKNRQHKRSCSSSRFFFIYQSTNWGKKLILDTACILLLFCIISFTDLHLWEQQECLNEAWFTADLSEGQMKDALWGQRLEVVLSRQSQGLQEERKSGGEARWLPVELGGGEHHSVWHMNTPGIERYFGKCFSCLFFSLFKIQSVCPKRIHNVNRTH